MKKRLFAKVEELNLQKDSKSFNFEGEYTYQPDKLMSIEDIINLDSTISERFVFKFEKFKNAQVKFLQMKVKEYFSHGKKIKLL